MPLTSCCTGLQSCFCPGTIRALFRSGLILFHAERVAASPWLGFLRAVIRASSIVGAGVAVNSASVVDIGVRGTDGGIAAKTGSRGSSSAHSPTPCIEPDLLRSPCCCARTHPSPRTYMLPEHIAFLTCIYSYHPHTCSSHSYPDIHTPDGYTGELVI